MKIFANVLAISGAFVGVIIAGSGFLMKAGWVPQVHSRISNFQITAGLVLAVLLLLLARSTKSLDGERRWFGFTVGLVGIGLLTLSGWIVVQSAQRIWTRPSLLQMRENQTQTQYMFNSDWVSRSADEWLRILKPYQAQPGVQAIEIGAFEGRSSIWFLEHILTHPSATITCIDVFSEEYTGYGNFSSYEKVFDRNVEASTMKSQVIKIKGDSKVILRTLPIGVYDFVYIDGSHIAKDVLMDAVLVWDLLKPGGVIIFDDYRTRGAPGHPQGPAYFPQIAIDAFLRVYKPYIDILHNDYQVIVRKREHVDLASQKYTILERLESLLY
jgi:predicted O-methyltransferase YrrM